MKVVVTGGLGFIGSHLVDHYIALGCKVVILDDMSTGTLAYLNPKARLIPMSLLDERLEDWLCNEKPDLINHHAAQVNVRASVDDPLHDLEVNMLGTARLLRAAGNAGTRRIIFASSGGTVYGEAANTLIQETYRGMPISPYGINKLACEQYVQFFAKKYGFEWVILRYANVYGPRQNPHGESGVIAIFLERLRRNLPPMVNGSGEQVRDYVHVSDVVRANMLFSTTDSNLNNIYNVGTGCGHSLNQLLTLLYQRYPTAPQPIHREAKLGDSLWNVLLIDKIKAVGWSPNIMLDMGLQNL